jgi:hypothetical protein
MIDVTASSNHSDRQPQRRQSLCATAVSPDSTAVSTILKPGTDPGQPFSLSFRQTADNFLSLYRNLKIQIVWAPQDRSHHEFARTKHLTNTTAPRPLPHNNCEPHTISYQRCEAKTTAINTWANRCSQTCIALPTPQPPNGKLPPVIKVTRGRSSPPLSGSSQAMPSSGQVPTFLRTAPVGHPRKPSNTSSRLARFTPMPDATFSIQLIATSRCPSR